MVPVDFKTLPICLLVVFSIISTAGSDDEIQFNRDIRTILSDACFQCHGPDDKERKGGFRLDLKKEAFTTGESGVTPIVPGNPDKSELLARVLLPEGDAIAGDRRIPARSGRAGAGSFLPRSSLAEAYHGLEGRTDSDFIELTLPTQHEPAQFGLIDIEGHGMASLFLR